jgi:hypothetical protein
MTDVLDRIPLRSVPDLGGLAVADAGGRPIGHVYGALAEADTGLIRYIDLDLSTSRRHVLVPIGHARIRTDRPTPDVRLRAAVLSDLERIPEYTPSNAVVDDAYERELLTAYASSFYGDRYYAHPAYDHSGLYVGEHPIVSVGAQRARRPAKPAAPSLTLLSDAEDYRVARDECDIRGWPLMTDADLPSGRVTDLVVDLDEEQVRYVIVDVADGAGATLLPVGFLQLDQRREAVRAPGLRHDDLASLPRFDHEAIGRELENTIRDMLRSRLLDRRRYSLPDFQAGRLTDRRHA